jgi:hypothetical protein
MGQMEKLIGCQKKLSPLDEIICETKDKTQKL